MDSIMFFIIILGLVIIPAIGLGAFLVIRFSVKKYNTHPSNKSNNREFVNDDLRRYGLDPEKPVFQLYNFCFWTSPNSDYVYYVDSSKNNTIYSLESIRKDTLKELRMLSIMLGKRVNGVLEVDFNTLKTKLPKSLDIRIEKNKNDDTKTHISFSKYIEGYSEEKYDVKVKNGQISLVKGHEYVGGGIISIDFVIPPSNKVTTDTIIDDVKKFKSFTRHIKEMDSSIKV